jgi:hypothetical protein
MFQVIVESLMSPPRALDLKAPKLEWSRNCDRPKMLFSNYCKEIIAMEYTMMQVMISTSSVVC